MKAHKLFKKAVAGVLSLALALGIAPSVMSSSQAYAGTAATPDISVYADKTALTDDTFTPNEDGTAAHVGKIKFGQYTWYLLGGSGGTNADIFATENFGDDVKFHDGNLEFNPTTDSEPWSSVVYSGSKPTTVYPNNYGASNLRVALQGYETSGFNSVEQSMMNETTVETTDLRNKAADDETPMTYTTTDKLYAPAEGNGNFTIRGTTIDVNNKKLATSTYWTSGGTFWLRSPHYDNDSYALLGYVNQTCYVYAYYTYFPFGVRPAANLDMSSVLLASAAPVETTDKAKAVIDYDVMTLRLKATENTTVKKSEIGTVSVDTDADTITATKGTGSATLVVQGKDSENDWYYTKALSDDTTTISAANIGEGVDLANCKVWLEIKGSDNMVYAVNNEDVITEHTVKFVYNNASDDTTLQIPDASTLTEPTVTKAGYKLDGWYITEDFTGRAWNFDTDTVIADVTLYAKWTKTNSDNGGSDSDNDNNGNSNGNSDQNTDNNTTTTSTDTTTTSDDSAKTGDDTNVLGLLAILTLAGAGTGTVFVRRRHN